MLSTITPSIGFEPAYVQQPLRDYLSSLAKVRALPDLKLLPAHGPGDRVVARPGRRAGRAPRRPARAVAAGRGVRGAYGVGGGRRAALDAPRTTPRRARSVRRGARGVRDAGPPRAARPAGQGGAGRRSDRPVRTACARPDPAAGLDRGCAPRPGRARSSHLAEPVRRRHAHDHASPARRRLGLPDRRRPRDHPGLPRRHGPAGLRVVPAARVTEDGKAHLDRYFRPYLDLAERTGAGFVLDTATWRANRDWGARLGCDALTLAEVNRRAVDYAAGLAEQAVGADRARRRDRPARRRLRRRRDDEASTRRRRTTRSRRRRSLPPAPR